MPAPRPVRAVIVTNIPAPYRIPVYGLLHDRRAVDLRVLYTADRESNRQWDLPAHQAPSRTLRSLVLHVGGRYVHLTRGTTRALRSARPDVVVTTGFNPPQLQAIAWCVRHGVPHVAQTDGTLRSEARLTALHRLVRRWTARRTAAFVAVSPEGAALQRRWGAPADRVFRSPLAIDNARFAAAHPPRDVDLLFSGQLTEVKNPLFALDVAAAAADRIGRRVTLTVLGDGPLRDVLAERAAAVADRVDVRIAGFQQQRDLPEHYARARVFLFPTRWDPWGLVANEAAAAGTPQVVSPHAGAGGELILDGVAGFVVPLEVGPWADRVALLLMDPQRWAAMSDAARDAVAPLSYAAAAEGLRAAILLAAGLTRPRLDP